MTHPLALLCAVPLEAEPLLRALADPEALEIGRRPATRGRLDGRPVVVLAGGMGKTNAAQALTALLEHHPVRGVVGFGVGGAYPGAGLEIGEVALASACVYADEGVEMPDGWRGVEQIGIPLLERGEDRHFNHFPLDPQRVGEARAALREAGVRAEVGPFLTVSTCSGTTQRGRTLGERFGAVCEGMEGAALAHVSALYRVPFLELRGISNEVEDRDLSRWRLREAAEAAAHAVRIVAAAWSGPPEPRTRP